MNKKISLLTIITLFFLSITLISASPIPIGIEGDSRFILNSGDLRPTGNYSFDAGTLFIDSTGNKIGIGTTKPSQSLDIEGGRIRATHGLYIPQGSDDSSTGIRFAGAFPGYVGTVANGQNLVLYTRKADGNYNINQLVLAGDGNVGIASLVPSTALFVNGTFSVVNQSGIQGLYQTASGKVGVGTTDPAQKLEVSGNLRLPDANYFEFSDGTKMYNNKLYNVQHNYSWTYWNGSEELTYIKMVYNGGKVGIGTTNPSQKLDVAGNINLTSSTPTLFGGTGLILDAGGASSLVFKTSETAQSRFDSSGNLEFTDSANIYTTNNGSINFLTTTGSTGKIGIGTTSPIYLIDAKTNSLVGANIIRLKGEGSGYVHSGLLLESSDITGSTPSVRGLGIFMYNKANNVTWYTGTPYVTPNGVDRFVINRYYNDSASSQYAQQTAGSSEPNVTNLLTITNTGNVGISTSVPNQKLTVTDTTASAGYVTNFTRNSQSFGVYTGGGDVDIGSITNHNLGFFTNSGTNQMTLATTGYLGIKTATPLNLLDVNGSINIGQSESGTIVYTSFASGRGWTGLNGGTSMVVESAGARRISFITNGTVFATGRESMSILDSGNVGIGTTAPTQKLHVIGNVAVESGNIYSTTVGNGIVFGGTSAYGLIKGSANNELIFNTNSTQRMIILNNGNVGINITTPAQKLEIDDGNILISRSTSTTKSYFIGEGNSAGLMDIGTSFGVGMEIEHNSTLYRDNLHFYTSNGGVASARRMTILHNGSVGINTINPLGKLDVAGSIYVASNNDDSKLFLGKYNSASGYGYITALNTSQGFDIQTKKSDANTVDSFVIDSPSLSYVGLRLDGSGNLGINAQSPAGKLDVNGSSYFRGAMGMNNNNINALDSLGFNNGAYLKSNNPVTYGIQVQIYNGTNLNNLMSFSPGQIISMNGSVGIGTTAPAYALDVIGAIQTNTGVYSNNYYPRTSAGVNIGSGTNPVSILTDKIFVNGTTGNVGIGTTAPSERLEVNGSLKVGSNFIVNNTNLQMYITNNISNTLSWQGIVNIQGNDAINTLGLSLRNSAIDVYSPSVNKDGGLRIWVDTEKALLQAYDGAGYSTKRNLILESEGGNVGIGNTTPQQKLVVAGNISVQDTAGKQWNCGVTTTGVFSCS